MAMSRQGIARIVVILLLIVCGVLGLISMLSDQWVTGRFENTVFKQDIWGARWVYDQRILCARVSSIIMVSSAGVALISIPAEACLLECKNSTFLKIVSIISTALAFITNMSMWSCMLDYTRHLVEDSRGSSNVQFGYSLALAIIACLGFLLAAVITGLLVCMKLAQRNASEKPPPLEDQLGGGAAYPESEFESPRW